MESICNRYFFKIIYNKNRSLIGLFLCLLFLLSNIFGQETDSYKNPVISAIDIQGLQNTKRYIIEREIQHPLNIPIDSSLVEKDRNRLENLGIFSEVTWNELPLEDGTSILNFRVIESISLLPIFSPVYNEEMGWFLILGTRLNNFRGRNEKLLLRGRIGNVSAYDVIFKNPWFFGDRVSIAFNFSKQIFEHYFLPYRQATQEFKINIGRYFGYEKQLIAGIELKKKEYFGQDTTSFYYLSPDLIAVYDTRDIYNDPSKGMYIFYYGKYFLNLNQIEPESTIAWTQSYSAYYSPIKGKRKTTLGFNLNISSITGFRNEYWLGSLGGVNSVRGWRIPSREIYSDQSQSYRFGYLRAISSLEIRQTIIPKYAFQSPSYFGPIRSELGLQTTLFIDLGIAVNNWEDLSDSAPMIGTGIGIRIPVAISGNVRLDYGWSFYNGEYIERALLFGIGQKF